MLRGSKAHRYQGAEGLLTVDKVLESSPGVKLAPAGEVFVAPDNLQAAAGLLAAASTEVA